MKTDIVKEYRTEYNTFIALEKLQTMKPKADESWRRFTQRMRKEGSLGDVVEDVVRRYIVDALPGNDKLSLYMCKNFDELNASLPIYESVYKSKVQPKSGKRNENGQHHSKSSKEKDDKERKGSNNCYNCNKEGHRASQCLDKEKGLACFKCGKWGHISKNCSERKSDESTAKKKSVNLIKVGMSEDFRQYKEVYFGAFKESAMID